MVEGLVDAASGARLGVLVRSDIDVGTVDVREGKIDHCLVLSRPSLLSDLD